MVDLGVRVYSIGLEVYLSECSESCASLGFRV